MNGVAGRRSLHTAGGHAPVAGKDTITSMVAWAEHRLGDAGVPNPRVDAEWLLAHALDVRRDYLWAHHDHKVSAAQHVRFTQCVARRVTREPLQYILGTQEFYGRTFRVTPDVLIPRPETELLVEAALQYTSPQSPAPSPRILEIGTGSGCIAITLALEWPTAQIVATDISPAALAIARTNAATHGASHRIQFIAGDVTQDAGRRTQDGLYDLLISNPPYCPEPQWGTLQPEVRDFEPRQALVAGKDGLDFLRRIIQDAPARLKPGGWLLLEIGDGQGQAIRSLLQTSEVFGTVRLRRDYHDVERIVIAQHQ